MEPITLRLEALANLIGSRAANSRFAICVGTGSAVNSSATATWKDL